MARTFLKSPTDAQLKNAGWTETHGIALWTHPTFDGVLVDTNSDALCVYPQHTRYGEVNVDSPADGMDDKDASDFLRFIGIKPERMSW